MANASVSLLIICPMVDAKYAKRLGAHPANFNLAILSVLTVMRIKLYQTSNAHVRKHQKQ